MIVGIGSDLCNIERIQKSLDRWGDSSSPACFTDIERAKAARRPFTAPEPWPSASPPRKPSRKAVGTGFKRGVFMKDIGVVNVPSGAADHRRSPAAPRPGLTPLRRTATPSTFI